MPSCYLTREFVKKVSNQHFGHTVRYADRDLPGFLFEQRPNSRGTWRFHYKTTDGKSHYCSLGDVDTMDIVEARAGAYKLYRSLKEGHLPEWTRVSKQLTLRQFADQYYLPHVKSSKRSWKSDESTLRTYIFPAFGDHGLASVSKMAVFDWFQELRRKGLGASTCNRTLAILRFFFNCAIRWGMLREGCNPCEAVKQLEAPPVRERYLNFDEARALLGELEQLSTPSALAIKLLLLTGARKSEILNARWECVDFDLKILTVPLSKSGKVRRIPLSDKALDTLRNIPRTESPWVFPNPKTGRPQRTLFHLWNDLRSRLNIPDVRLHDLRHSFASFLVNSGCSLYEVQTILGHHDPRVTMRYAHLSDQNLLHVVNSVPRLLSENSPPEKGAKKTKK